MMFAADIQWPQTMTTVAGLVGLLTIGVLGLTFWSLCKKLFGLTPPMGEEMDKRDKKLRQMIFASETNLKAAIDRAEKRTDRLEDLYREMEQDRARKWSVLQNQLHDLDKKIAIVIDQLSRKDQNP
ncbi:MAG: hypothetical protein H7Y43_08000 [Akkermansiaceae bacterium]|nr:hypothetical protein [Verrucomicrobiales bacterium]